MTGVPIRVAPVSQPVVVGAVQGELGFAIGLGVTGLLILGIGLVPVFGKDVFLRPRRFVFDPAGIRWEDRKGAPWALRWDELGAVVVSTSGARTVPDGHGGTRSYAEIVRVDLHPAGPQVRAQHPELEHLWEFDEVSNGYRVPLGPNPDLIGQLDRAIRTFDRDGIYRGVVQSDGGLY